MACFHRFQKIRLAVLAASLSWFSALSMVVYAQSVDPTVKKLAPSTNPDKNAVLIGRVAAGGMQVQLELEGAEPMWMQMGNPPAWGAHQPAAVERYHGEVKVTDPKSKSRTSYANLKTKTCGLKPSTPNSTSSSRTES